ncbi:hypothetical protein AB0E62_00480 [Streptomyces sp. NPDC038707]|uniref:hypothetical protein n=1 Tax=Streptomyces sp. NPDC038707 TaxID=3154329 RepID=UPI0033F7FD8C
MARYSTSAGVRGIAGESGDRWLPGDSGAWLRSDSNGPSYVLEKRTRNSKDETRDTGWYLYDDQPNGFFGEWCGTRILEAVDKANQMINEATRGEKYGEEYHEAWGLGLKVTEYRAELSTRQS